MTIKNHFHKQYLMIKIYQNVDIKCISIFVLSCDAVRHETIEEEEKNQKYIQIYSPKMPFQ